MEEPRLNPLNDYLFMKYMGEKGDEEQFLAFLNVVFRKPAETDMLTFRHLREKDIENNPLHRWLTFFDKKYE
jgi:hypothetical protein